MAGSEYRLTGHAHIPLEKQSEFNDCILTVLNYFGVKKTTTISIDDKSFVVTEPVAIDEYGNISFNYCTLENKQYETSIFSVITGNFEKENCGYDELGVVRNLLLTISAAFSNTPCFVLRDGHPMRMLNLLRPLNYIFNHEFPCHSKWDIWEIYSFFHYCKDVDDITPMDAWHTLATEIDKRTQNQLEALFMLETEIVPPFDNKTSISKEQFSNEKWPQQEELLFTILTKHKDDNTFIPKLRELLNKGIEERIQYVDENDDDMALLALLSLNYYAPVIVKALSLIKECDFWTLWESMNVKHYTKVIDEPLVKDIPKGFVRTPVYKITLRDDEDEFLHLWNGENLIISAGLRTQIEEWKQEYQNVQPTVDFDMEDALIAVLQEMHATWDCPYVDKAIIEEFIANKDDVRYQKLLLVLDKFINKGLEMFPELTKAQANDWILNRARDKKEITHITSYLQLLGNNEQRKRIFDI